MLAAEWKIIEMIRLEAGSGGKIGSDGQVKWHRRTATATMAPLALAIIIMTPAQHELHFELNEYCKSHGPTTVQAQFISQNCIRLTQADPYLWLKNQKQFSLHFSSWCIVIVIVVVFVGGRDDGDTLALYDVSLTYFFCFGKITCGSFFDDKIVLMFVDNPKLSSKRCGIPANNGNNKRRK